MVVDKEFILKGDVDFEVRHMNFLERRGFYFQVRKTATGLHIYGAPEGGKPKYIGILYPKSGHLKRTSKTLLDRHQQTSAVFLWAMSLIWWSDGRLPANYRLIAA